MWCLRCQNERQRKKSGEKEQRFGCRRLTKGFRSDDGRRRWPEENNVARRRQFDPCEMGLRFLSGGLWLFSAW